MINSDFGRDSFIVEIYFNPSDIGQMREVIESSEFIIEKLPSKRSLNPLPMGCNFDPSKSKSEENFAKS